MHVRPRVREYETHFDISRHSRREVMKLAPRSLKFNQLTSYAGSAAVLAVMVEIDFFETLSFVGLRRLCYFRTERQFTFF